MGSLPLFVNFASFAINKLRKCSALSQLFINITIRRVKECFTKYVRVGYLEKVAKLELGG